MLPTLSTPAEIASAVDDSAFYDSTFAGCNTVSHVSSAAAIASAVTQRAACHAENLSNYTGCTAVESETMLAEYLEIVATRTACINAGYPPAPPSSSAPAPAIVYSRKLPTKIYSFKEITCLGLIRASPVYHHFNLD